jgi:uncharacterized NAD(P)/FAD-binding protein YdhS
MVSRNGRLPLPHADHGEPPMLAIREQFAGSPAKVLSALRSAARQRMAAGLGWQGAIDAIRPHITAIWKSWSTAERSQFIRRARALWEIHRHRVPCSVLADITAQCAAGTLLIERGDPSRRESDGKPKPQRFELPAGAGLDAPFELVWRDGR